MIKAITHKQADKVINTREPYGRFIVIDDGFFTGIDNTTHDAWTEDFKDIKNCLAFLNGADLEDCLEGYKQCQEAMVANVRVAEKKK